FVVPTSFVGRPTLFLARFCRTRLPLRRRRRFSPHLRLGTAFLRSRRGLRSYIALRRRGLRSGLRRCGILPDVVRRISVVRTWLRSVSVIVVVRLLRTCVGGI